jgi:hypothetical protein
MSNCKDPFTDTSRFWVIFDTCQLEAYYQDIHNVLALPPGAIIRYDYRTCYISDDALAVLQARAAAPRDALLIYMQYPGYRRELGLEYRPAPNEPVLAVATRLARMRLTPNIGGERYALDLELKGYPREDIDALNEILRPLKSANQTPWSKWVSISTSTDHFAKLKSGKDADKWVAIVQRLSTPPMQFAGDAFWRLAPPIVDGRKSVSPSFEMESLEAPGGARRVSFSYRLREGQRCEFELFSHVAHIPGTPVRQVHVEVPKDGPLQFDGPADLGLRYDAATNVVIRGIRSESVDERVGRLNLYTPTAAAGWPIGPQLALEFKVFKSRPATTVGVVCLLGAVVCGVVAAAFHDSVVWPIFLAVVAGALTLVGLALLTRKIGVKL